MNTVPGYEPLAAVLQQALDQSQSGKGNTRHANGKPFLKQPILEIGRMVGLGYPAGQAQKKLQEAVSMAGRGESQAAKAEFLGAIVYAAAAVLLIDEAETAVEEPAKAPDDKDGWIEWGGGKCPVSSWAGGDVKFRNGSYGSATLSLYDWSNNGRESDIVAYKVDA